jgi:hypothetical protein
MASWPEVTGRDEPVRGPVLEFERAAQAWSDAATKSDQLKSEFTNLIGHGDRVYLQGQAADALSIIIAESRAVIDDVPSVCHTLAGLMRQHQSQLAELRLAADQALARAAAAWNDRRSAESSRDAHAIRLASLKRQLQQLKALPPEQSATQIQTVQLELNRTTSSHGTAVNQVNSANGRLSAELTKWDELRSGEDALNNRTTSSLNSVDLKSLKDPGWLEEQLWKFTDFLVALGENLKDLCEAVVNRDWDAFLWAVNGLADKLLTIMDVLQIEWVVAIVAFAVGGPAAAVAAFKIVGAIKLGLEALRFGTSLILAVKDSTNPKTGEKITPGDLFTQGVGLGLSLLTFGKMNGKLNNIATSGQMKSAMTRTFLSNKDVVLKDFGEISVKRTLEAKAKDIGKELLVEGVERTFEAAHLDDKSLVNAAFGVPNNHDQRLKTIQNGIIDIRRQQHGLTSGMRPCLIPAGASDGRD